MRSIPRSTELLEDARCNPGPLLRHSRPSSPTRPRTVAHVGAVRSGAVPRAPSVLDSPCNGRLVDDYGQFLLAERVQVVSDADSKGERAGRRGLPAKSNSFRPRGRRPSTTLNEGCLFDDAQPVTVMKNVNSVPTWPVTRPWGSIVHVVDCADTDGAPSRSGKGRKQEQQLTHGASSLCARFFLASPRLGRRAIRTPLVIGRKGAAAAIESLEGLRRSTFTYATGTRVC